MKKVIVIPLLFSFFVSFSQGSNIAFVLSDGLPYTRDNLTDLKLPLEISFSYDLKGSELLLNDNTGTKSEIDKQIIGIGGLEFQRTDPCVYVIEKEMRTNPGDKIVPSSEIVLHISNRDFLLKLDNTPVPNNKGVTTEKTTRTEDYEAGYIYYDAMKLKEKKYDPRTTMQILGSYGIVDSATISKNPYLNSVFGELYKNARPQGVEIGPLMTRLGNTDITYFASGFARFLAERTKDELNEAFFNKMKVHLNAYPELRTLYPKTVSFLDLIETYSYSSVMQVLKESFETDIKNLPENLYNIKSLTSEDCKSGYAGDNNEIEDCRERLDKLQTFFAEQEGLWIGLGMFTVKEIMRSPNPAHLLKSVNESSELNLIKEYSKKTSRINYYNIASSIEVANFISQSLISKNENEIWIDLKQFNELFKDTISFKVYLGLMIARELKADKKIEFYVNSDKTVSFGEILTAAYSKYKKYEPEIISLISNSHSAFNSANNAVKNMRSATDKSVEASPEALYSYFKTFTASIKQIIDNSLINEITGKDFSSDYARAEKFLNPSVDIAYHISSKKYSAAVYDASILLRSLNEITVSKKNRGFEPVTKSFLKYGSLISTVANAQSSDELKAALESSVLPDGSYAIKSKTSWSFSLNAYAGAYWNYSNKNDYLTPLGLSAPIGFNISKGLSKARNLGSLGLNLQVVDLGALVNYYLLNGDAAALPNEFNVRLSNVFAPGFNVCYNIPKTPLSLAWGGQYIPVLYEVDPVDSKTELTPVSAWRWQFSLLVDIPLMNLKVFDFNK